MWIQHILVYIESVTSVWHNVSIIYELFCMHPALVICVLNRWRGTQHHYTELRKYWLICKWRQATILNKWADVFPNPCLIVIEALPLKKYIVCAIYLAARHAVFFSKTTMQFKLCIQFQFSYIVIGRLETNWYHF